MSRCGRGSGPCQGLVADVEDAVFNSPMLSGQVEQRIGIGLIRWQRGDAVLRLGGCLAAQRPLTNQLEGLREVRPIDVARQRGAARQRACLHAAVRLGGGGTAV